MVRQTVPARKTKKTQAHERVTYVESCLCLMRRWHDTHTASTLEFGSIHRRIQLTFVGRPAIV